MHRHRLCCAEYKDPSSSSASAQQWCRGAVWQRRGCVLWRYAPLLVCRRCERSTPELATAGATRSLASIPVVCRLSRVEGVGHESARRSRAERRRRGCAFIGGRDSSQGAARFAVTRAPLPAGSARRLQATGRCASLAASPSCFVCFCLVFGSALYAPFMSPFPAFDSLFDRSQIRGIDVQCDVRQCLRAFRQGRCSGATHG